jgi:hypothetical protein
MSLFCSKTDLVTESDVEQKLIYPLLSSAHGLGFFAEEIKTKSYLAPTDIDKGAGRKVGYYPDYAIILSSLPALIVEAKAPGESVEKGFNEAQLYAHEINKRFAVVDSLFCNGSETMVVGGVSENATFCAMLVECWLRKWP